MVVYELMETFEPRGMKWSPILRPGEIRRSSMFKGAQSLIVSSIVAFKYYCQRGRYESVGTSLLLEWLNDFTSFDASAEVNQESRPAR